MFSNLRRVVTGNDASGKSLITFDGAPPASYEMGAGGLYELWDSAGNSLNSQDKLDRGLGKVVLGPQSGGVKFRYFAIAPTPEGISNDELNKMKEDLDNVKGELGEIKGLLSTLVQKLNN